MLRVGGGGGCAQVKRAVRVPSLMVKVIIWGPENSLAQRYKQRGVCRSCPTPASKSMLICGQISMRYCKGQPCAVLSHCPRGRPPQFMMLTPLKTEKGGIHNTNILKRSPCHAANFEANMRGGGGIFGGTLLLHNPCHIGPPKTEGARRMSTLDYWGAEIARGGHVPAMESPPLPTRGSATVMAMSVLLREGQKKAAGKRPEKAQDRNRQI